MPVLWGKELGPVGYDLQVDGPLSREIFPLVESDTLGGLVQAGWYDLLLNPATRKKIEDRPDFPLQIYYYLLDQAHFIANHPDVCAHDPIKGIDPNLFVTKAKYLADVSASIFAVFGEIANFQKTLNPKYLDNITRSPLLFGDGAILGYKPTPWRGDSSEQQVRMFLLGIRGLNTVQAEPVIDYARMPPCDSRKYTGKLPAGIIRMVDRIVKADREPSGILEEFVERMTRKALYGWPSPLR